MQASPAAVDAWAPVPALVRVVAAATPGVLALLALLGAPAQACSLAGESPVARFVSPRPLSRGVPTNAEVKLYLSGPRDDGETFTLRDDSAGVDVPVRRSVVVDEEAGRRADHRLVRLRPEAPLAPGHAYVVAWGSRELTRFTVGDGADGVAPSRPGRVAADFEASENFCFGDTRRYDLDFTDAEDGQTPAEELVYLARLAGPAGRVVPLTPADRWLGRKGFNGNVATREPVALEGELVAVDWAGNESEPRNFSVSSGLALTEPVKFWRMIPETGRLLASGACFLGILAAGGLLSLVLRRAQRPPA